MKFLFVTALLFLLYSPAIFCQANKVLLIDSLRIEKLKLELPLLKGLKKVDQLNEISKEYHHYTYSFSQNRTDSIKKYSGLAYKAAEAMNYKYGKALALIEFAMIEIYSNNFQQAQQKIKEVLAIANALKNDKLKGDVYLTECEIFYKLASPKYIETVKKALEYYTAANDHDGITIASGWLCTEYKFLGKYEEGIDFCTKCISEGSKKTSRYVSYEYFLIKEALTNLSGIYETVGDYNEAIKYLHNSRNYSKAINGEWTVYADLGHMFNKLGNFDSAYYYFNLYQKTDPGNLFTQTSVAETHLLSNRLDKALDLLLKIKDSRGQKETGTVYKNLSKTYVARKEYNNALIYASRWMPWVRTSKNPEILIDANQLWANIYAGLGNFDSAFYYQKKYSAIKDSISNKQFLWRLNNKLYQYKKATEDAQKATQIALLQKDVFIKEQQLKEESLLKQQREAQFALIDKDNQLYLQQLKQEALLKEQRDAKIALLDRDNKILDKSSLLKSEQLEQEATIKYILLAGLVALSLIGIFIFRNLSLKRKNEKLSRERIENEMKLHQLESEKKHAQLLHQATELEMQALRAQMNPHFIFNCLSSINKYIIKNETEAASDYLTRFSRLIRMVLINSQKSLITLEDELDMLRLYLDMERLRFRNCFNYNITYTNTIEPAAIFIPPLLLQPFCENAIWHGLMHKKGQGQLDVLLTIEEGFLQCNINDNGVGRIKAAELKSKSAEKQKSLGLNITSNRLALLNENKSQNTSYAMNDILDGNGNAAGTNVTLKIKYQELVEA